MTKARDVAIGMRKQGYSFSEISEKIGISKSTASVWSRGIILSDKAEKRLLKIRNDARAKGNQTSRRHREELQLSITKMASMSNKNARSNKEADKITLALVYFCEGAKNPNAGISFTNSDPALLAYFVYALRNLFKIDETKWSLSMHLHSYHNEARQLSFWQNTLRIPSTSFRKSFFKKESGITIRKGYPGCLRVRYRSSLIAKELLAIGREYMRGL